MIYCPACRAPNADAARACQVCGVALAPTAPRPDAAPLAATSPPSYAYGAPPPPAAHDAVDDGRVGWLGILYFLFPLAGGVMWLVWRRSRPRKARRAGILALCGLLFGVILEVASAFAG